MAIQNAIDISASLVSCPFTNCVCERVHVYALGIVITVCTKLCV